MSFIHSLLDDEAGADEAFSLFAVDVWRGLPAFRGDASLRTWAYCIARRAAGRVRRGVVARDARYGGDEAAASDAVAHVRTTTAIFKRTDVKDRVRLLREQLTSEEQELLTLRVDRALEWREIAHVVLEGEPSAADVTKHAAQLRKRFERAKDKLQKLADAAGLLAD